jgi:hypothetical protein
MFTIARFLRLGPESSLYRLSERTARLLDAPSDIFSVPIGTRVDPTGFFHERLQPRPGTLAISDISQRSRPFADRLAIDFIVTRAANHGSKWVGAVVEGEIR